MTVGIAIQPMFDETKRSALLRRRLNESEDVTVRVTNVEFQSVGHLPQRLSKGDTRGFESRRKRLRVLNTDGGVNELIGRKRISRNRFSLGSSSRISSMVNEHSLLSSSAIVGPSHKEANKALPNI